MRLRSTSSKAALIDAEHGECFLSNGARDAACSTYFGKVARTAEQAIGDARCATATTCDFFGAAFVHFNLENLSGAVKDDEKIGRLVEIEAVHDAETGAQRSGDEAGTRGCADEREMAQLKWMNARARALADDKVDAEIFHGGIENFLDGGLETVNFIEKENFLAFERGEDGGQVAFAFEERACAGLNGDI